ncbi:MAG: hypothetical protein KDI36_11950 [Pseudomonadales bacterium]|nr:hypothetical protein [Pseudomonadales bacterium]
MNIRLLKQWLSATAILVMALGMASCGTTTVVRANSTPAIQSSGEQPEIMYLDIGILPLEPNIPETEAEQQKQLIIPDVRRAESRYIAYHLKDTLEQTGHWGAVRVLPRASEAVHLTMSGEIIESNGESLEARIMVRDATGKVWFNQIFKDGASKYSYRAPREDPFQDFYNDVANAVLAARDKITAEDAGTIQRIASLRYAADLSPDAFDGYLQESRGRYRIAQLPADSDAMLGRVSRIRERENMFVDTLDDYYGQFYRDMKPSYDEWRNATYDESLSLKEMKAKAFKQYLAGVALIAGGLYGATESNTWAGQAAGAAAVGGGVMAIKAGMDRTREAEIHAQSLHELSQSLGAEITPHVLSIEGRTVELTGTADAQYDEWRRILREIYAEETGQPVTQQLQ